MKKNTIIPLLIQKGKKDVLKLDLNGSIFLHGERIGGDKELAEVLTPNTKGKFTVKKAYGIYINKEVKEL
jgi:hypothetical protein